MTAIKHGGSVILLAAVFAAGLILPILADSVDIPSNAYCPVTTDEPVEPDIFTEYEGQTVFFCCNKCRRKFLADPDQYLSALTTTEKVNADHHHDGEEEVHDHAQDHGQGQSKWATFLGKLHPMMVHFPIALFIMTGLGELLAIITKRYRFSDFAHISLWAGIITGLLAGLFGWLNEEGRSWKGVDAELVENHESVAIALLVVAILALIIRPRGDDMNRKRGIIFRGLVVLLVLLTMVTGHLGGSLVFGPDYLTW